MIKINKSAEPSALRRAKRWGVKSYDLLDGEVKGLIRESLLKEQGHICAYCMKSLPDETSQGNPQGVKIEHLISQQQSKTDPQYAGKDLDYDNMVAVCQGKTDGSLHCDSSRSGSRHLSFIPNLFNGSLEATISYNTRTGEIKSSNLDWHKDMTDADCLNLNFYRLRESRKNVIDALIRHFDQIGWSSKHLQAYLTEFNSREKKPAYWGVIRYFLQRHIILLDNKPRK